MNTNIFNKDTLDLKLSQEYYDSIRMQLLNNRDSFDNEIFKLVVKYGKLKSIETPYISVSDRHRLHMYERSGIHIYTFGDLDLRESFSRMDIAIDNRYIRVIKKKFQNNNIDDLIENFKSAVISDISNAINLRASEFFK